MPPVRKNKPRDMNLPSFDPAPSARFAASVLAETGAPAAIIGRFAVWAWLPDRPEEHQFTKDIDFAIEQEYASSIERFVRNRGVKAIALPIGGVGARHHAMKVAVDFIHRSRRGDLSPLFSDAIHKARHEVRLEGEVFLLAPAEHLVAMKIATTEADDEKDAQRLLRFADVSISKTRTIVKRFLGAMGMAKLESILRSIGHPDAMPMKEYD